MGLRCFKASHHAHSTAPDLGNPELLPQDSHPPFQSRFKRGVLIGQGAYGQVYECLDINTGQLYAMKHITLAGAPDKIQKAVNNLKREIAMLRELNHRNIVKYVGAEIAEDHPGVDIILEFVPGGSLRQLLDKFQKFDEPMARKYVRQLLEGLDYLHGLGIIHRDVKCSNLLSYTDALIKITDFGASKRLINSQINEDYVVCKSLKGSPYWMAPEVARRSGHSYPADIWSVGCTLIEIITGKPPWSDVSTSVKEVLTIIANARKPPSFPANISPECESFLVNCLQIDPEKRATAEQLLQHCFILGEKAANDDLQRLLRSTSVINHILPIPKNEPEDREEVKIIVPRISLKSKIHSSGVHQVPQGLHEEQKSQPKSQFRDEFTTNPV